MRFEKTKGEIWVEKAIFGAIWGGFEGFGPCLGISHPTHPHLGKISQKNVFFGSFPNLNLRIISLHTVPIYSESLRFDFYYLGWIFIIQGGSQGDGSLIVRFVLVPPVAISLKNPTISPAGGCLDGSPLPRAASRPTRPSRELDSVWSATSLGAFVTEHKGEYFQQFIIFKLAIPTSR